MPLGFPQQTIIKKQLVTIRDPAIGFSRLFPKLDIGDWAYVHCTIKSTGSPVTPGDDGMVVLNFVWTYDASPAIGPDGGSVDEFIVPLRTGTTPDQSLNVPVRGRYLEIRAISWPSPSEWLVEWTVGVSNKIIPLPTTPMLNPVLATCSVTSTPPAAQTRRSAWVFYGRALLSYRFFLASAADNANVIVEVANRTGGFSTVYFAQVPGPQPGNAITAELPCLGTWYRLTINKIGVAGLGDISAQLAPFPSPSYGS